jgi:hypothetical protein
MSSFTIIFFAFTSEEESKTKLGWIFWNETRKERSPELNLHLHQPIIFYSWRK